MICDFCKKEYKEKTKIFDVFGSKFCVHDGEIKVLEALNGYGSKNDSLSVSVARRGNDKIEQKYIDNNKVKGNTVVRGSDGLLRALEKE